MKEYTPPNKHTCLFYNSKDELLDILVPYFKAGLENNEFCLWVVPEILKSEEAKSVLSKAVENLDRYFEKGQMEIWDSRDFYLKSVIVTSFEMLEYWTKKEKEILGQGFARMRVGGDGNWGLSHEYWLNLNLYEQDVNRMIEGFQGMALCTYAINKLQLHQIFNLGVSHQSSLCKRMGQWDNIPPSDFSKAQIK
jgi:hypothetical protein